MVFSSLQFLFFFLPVTLGLYFVVTGRLRNVVLLAASLLFYVWGGGMLVLVLLASIAVDYGLGFWVDRARRLGRTGARNAGIAASVVVNVGLLVWFKYADFFIDQYNLITPLDPVWIPRIVLPIGISFYTFQSMSYTIDVARGHAPHLRNPLDFALYVALFPQLVAGPIVRYREIAAELRRRSSRLEDVSAGMVRFAHGLVKKVVVADTVAVIADAAFGAGDGTLTAGAAWLGVLAYTIQIYFDFSGYSDMAIGLGLILGFHFPENFDRPYSAVSVTDFWRRWHITLSRWFRDYVYIPLGGSRGGRRTTYGALLTVFLLTGLWHGAAWTFVAWGLYHGALLVVERVTGQRALDGEVRRVPLRRAAVFLAVVLGWVLFRADDLGHAGEVYAAMFSFDWGLTPEVAAVLTRRNLITLAAALAVVLLPRGFSGADLLVSRRGLRPALARAAVLLVALPYAGMLVAGGTFSPFLYFRF